MIKKSSFIVIVAALASSPELFAQSRAGTTAAPFLTMGVGAKGQSLGNANSIMSTGAEGLFWNPATISIDRGYGSGISAMFNVHELFVGVEAYATGLVLPIGKGKSIGLGANLVNYGRQDVRTVSEPQGTGATFGAYDLSIGVSYAQNLAENFYFGVTTKFVQQKIFDMTAETFAFDFGFVLLTDYLNGASLGATISNFGGTMQMNGINTRYVIDIDPNSDGNNTNVPSNLYTDEWDLPLSFKFGLAVPAVKTDFLELNLMSELQQTNDNNMNVDNGAQLSYLTKTIQFHVRSGYRDFLIGDEVDSHFSYGLGVSLKTASGPTIVFDFAQVPFEYLGMTTLLDIKLFF
ncbi:PorV/PorQ family protein [Balneola sp. MJW-20]|uniref:PorV/PorQ family protein n=1 Tax=Gracilimonas aurantiaca TaxID=3234185 RepID=UPI003465A910